MKNPFTLLSILLINMKAAQVNHQAAVNHVLAQIQSHLLAHQYEGLIRKAKLKGRRG